MKQLPLGLQAPLHRSPRFLICYETKSCETDVPQG